MQQSDHAFAQAIEARIITLDDVPFPQLNTSRRIRVLLPEGYDSSDERYPVIYMHDGQNVFFDADAMYEMAWKVQECTDDCIVVAIDNSPAHEGMGRFDEYSPWQMDPHFVLPGRDERIHLLGGKGAEYAEFVAVNVKQLIDSRFRTRPQREHTVVAGSSMGGLISLYIALQYNQVFGCAGVFSPAFWFHKAPFFELADRVQLEAPLKLYMDMGTNETSDETREDFPMVYLNDAKEMAELLSAKANVSLRFEVGEGEVHNERAWRRRFPMFMKHCL